MQQTLRGMIWDNGIHTAFTSVTSISVLFITEITRHQTLMHWTLRRFRLNCNKHVINNRYNMFMQLREALNIFWACKHVVHSMMEELYHLHVTRWSIQLFLFWRFWCFKLVESEFWFYLFISRVDDCDAGVHIQVLS